MKIFLFQKGIIDTDTNIELAKAVSISTKPSLSCSFSTNIYKTKEEKNPSNIYSVIENPILKKAFNRR